MVDGGVKANVRRGFVMGGEEKANAGLGWLAAGTGAAS